MIVVRLDRNLERSIARLPEVHREVRAEVNAGAAKAKANLAAHRDTGKSKVVTVIDAVDGFIVLDDERDFRASMSIEKGTSRTRPTDVLTDVYGPDAMGGK